MHLLHGLPGCGKTHFARSLVSERPIAHLSHDACVIRLYGTQPTQAQIESVRGPLHALLWTCVAALVQAGSDVVLDHGFWTRQERDAARDRVRRLGANHRLYAFDCPPSLAWERLQRRNRLGVGDSLQVDEAAFQHFAARIQPPQPDEACTHLAG